MTSTQPILVCMVWRGGARFARCLESIQASPSYFSRIVLSITGPIDGPDMELARQASDGNPDIEVICTERELPTMQHQAFWIEHLLATGAKESDWIYWLAYDDEVRPRGIRAITDNNGEWPLKPGTAYFGPWAMRHEKPDALWRGDPSEGLESWTSFPTTGPTRLPVARWIADQLQQPTYMQMSGSVNQLRSFIDLKDKRPRKSGPMRIEMAIASAPGVTEVEEFAEPVSIIYGRSNSDRASYGSAARREDAHLATWLLRYSATHPTALAPLATALARTAITTGLSAIGRSQLPAEEWRVRGTVEP
jgi:hypothetical protein